MTTNTKKAQSPLILRCHRLMDAFAKSDDERDFYIDRTEGFIVFVDLDKSQEELNILEKEMEKNKDRYLMIPKMSFYECKKIMEGFVHEKVYDIDTKEKLLDIISSKEAREHFIEFIYDHHNELEKWQQFYQERSRIRIIEWLRSNNFHFVFEEDLEMTTSLIEKLKSHLFENKAGKEIEVARKAMVAKAKTYYSNEALNPRPKRGRPPKQQLKLEIEPHVTSDIYTTVPSTVRPFLYIPEISSAFDVTFSAKFETKDALMASRRLSAAGGMEESMESINAKLATLKELSSRWLEKEGISPSLDKGEIDMDIDFSLDDDDEDEEELLKKLKDNGSNKKKAPVNGKVIPQNAKTGKLLAKPIAVKEKASLKAKPAKKEEPKRFIPKAKTKPTPKVNEKAKKPLRKIARVKPVKAKVVAKVSTKKRPVKKLRKTK